MQAISFNFANISQQASYTKRQLSNSTPTFSTLLQPPSEQVIQVQEVNESTEQILLNLLKQLEQQFPNEMKLLLEKIEEGNIQGGMEGLLQLVYQLQTSGDSEVASGSNSQSIGNSVMLGETNASMLEIHLKKEFQSLEKKDVQLLSNVKDLNDSISKTSAVLNKYEVIVKNILKVINEQDGLKNSNSELKQGLTFFQSTNDVNKVQQMGRGESGALAKENNQVSTTLTLNSMDETIVSSEQKYLLHVQNQGKKIDEGSFVKDLSKIINNSQLQETNGQKKLLIRLFPENLGYLKIELIQKQDGVVARILASSEASKKLLQNHLNDMKQQLGVTSISIERMDQQATMIQQEKTNWKQQEQQQNQPNQQHQQQKEENKKEKNIKSFIEELLKIEE